MTVRPLSQIRHVLQKTEQRAIGGSYSHIRALCSKAGEGMVINIQDEEDFEERVINSDKPVVVDFHARLDLSNGTNVRQTFIVWQCSTQYLILAQI